ncbi:Uncharacterised protein [uncultured archaeon]|nr:Uncharacterised protein [uncultured archaeon]
MPITPERQAVLTRWGTDSVDAGLNCGNMTATINPDGTLKKMSSKWDYDAAAQAYSLMNMGFLPRGINYMDRVMYQNLNQIKDQVLKDMDASSPVVVQSAETPLEQIGAQ